MMDMARKTGWIEETTFGTSPLSTPASDTVTHWGKLDYGWEMPWHEEPVTPVYNAGTMMPTEVVRGTNKLEHEMKFGPVHAWDWKYAGLNNIADGGGGVYTFTPSNSVALKSRTGYYEEEDDIIVAKGLVTRDLDFYVAVGEPAYMHAQMVGTESAAGTKITTATNPVWPASINSTDTVGWQRLNDVELNDVDLGFQNVHIKLHNFLKRRDNAMNAAGNAANYAVKSWKRYAMAVEVNIGCAFDGTANDWWALFKAATRDKKFEFKLLWNTSYYWLFTIQPMRFTYTKINVPAPNDEGQDVNYVINGMNYYDGSNASPSLVVKDGATYS